MVSQEVSSNDWSADVCNDKNASEHLSESLVQCEGAGAKGDDRRAIDCTEAGTIGLDSPICSGCGWWDHADFGTSVH